MTENEASTKWCPMVRVGAVAPNGSVMAVNRHGPDQFPPELCCVGSRCAAWRGSSLMDMSGDSHGFCGLAGSQGGSVSNLRVVS